MPTIREDDLTGEAIRALLAFHLTSMRDNSPPGQSFALDLSGLQQPGVTVWTAWDGEALAGVGALKIVDANLGEVKSMRTHPDHLRKGVAAVLLDRIIETAKAQGLKQLSLETGSGEAFEAALALYRNRGFKDGGAFADYVDVGFSHYLHLEL